MLCSSRSSSWLKNIPQISHFGTTYDLHNQIIVSGEKPLSYVKEFLGLTHDITMFLYNCRLSKYEEQDAAKLGIKIVDEIVTRIDGGQGRKLKQLRTRTGRHVFYKLGCMAQNELAKQLGCQLDDDGYVKLTVGNRQQSVAYTQLATLMILTGIS